MNLLRPLLLMTLSACAAVAVAGSMPAEPKNGDVVMRAPFVLTLHVDKDHYYEEKIDEMPYVYENGVYLMKGDNFGVTLEISAGKVTQVRYQPDIEKADLTFEFRQEVDAEPNGMMLLTIRNRTPHRLTMKGLMTVPGHKGTAETSLLPVEAGLTNFESWPHPIVKLLLRDIQVGK